MASNSDFSHLFSTNPEYLEEMYQQFKQDPELVEPSWRAFFFGLSFQLQSSGESGGGVDEEQLRKEFNVFRMIQGYRSRGHFLSDTNPIRSRKDRDARISLKHYDLDETDLSKVFMSCEFAGLPGKTLKEVVEHLDAVYCRKIGIEYAHSNDTDVRRWVRKTFEETYRYKSFPLEKQKRILRKLNEATVFEQFLQTKFVGQKRFSLEGGETTIPALDSLINKGAELGAREFILGMAHRGRLNVLANIMGKTYEFIFKEFEGGKEDSTPGRGDVKYHLGYTTINECSNGTEVTLKLIQNPSHLETVDPVVQGYARAQGDLTHDSELDRTVPILIHGDAAIAGQGIVYEILQMSQLDGYKNGGTIHFVINNQIGFTTDWMDGRSTNYCTSLAKALDAPILHVNGDDPEAVVYACELAMEFRQKFHQDVFIDMVCYRKHGHNEGDEPKYTQPHLYGLVAKHKNPREVYIESLLSRGSIDRELAKQIQDEFKTLLNDRFNNVKQKTIPQRKKGPHTAWAKLRPSAVGDFKKSPATGVARTKLDKVIKALTSVPEGFNLLKKAKRILDERKKSFEQDQLDWALCELLAFGTILQEGNHVRFSGQDVIRGTFSQRHAKVFDELSNEAYCGLQDISEEQGQIHIYNSLLSEYAVLGFEYGYSLAYPHGLVIWEAQFGDFANGAQIMIDQYIAASETKWSRMSGLVLLLPHGHEGQGPEHTSGRPERFLQLAAEDNIVITMPTTPANHFHMLRRQLAWEFRKPLIAMTPKSLLRDPRCLSTVDELAEGCFQEVIDDNYVTKSKVKKVLYCSGKIYYDLYQKQQELEDKTTAIIRIEQLHPFPIEQVKAVMKKYGKAKSYWVQEEPKNMGAFTYLCRIPEFFESLDFIGREESASPATGFNSVHKEEQLAIIEECFK